MKIRRGFVSNSSSSSFIIAVDEQNSKPCEYCGRKDLDIFNYVDRGYGETEVLEVGYDEVIRYVNEYYFEPEKIINKINLYKDKKIMLLDIDYHDELTNHYINNSPNITIINCEG